MKLYSEPRIHDRDEDLSKRWYLKFSYRHPVTGKMKPFKKDEGVNTLTTVAARKKQLRKLQKVYASLLSEGWSPFEFFEEKSTGPTEKTTVADVYHYFYQYQEQHLQLSTWRGVKAKFKAFEKYLKGKFIFNIPADELTKGHIVSFLDQLKVGETTYNDYLAHLRSGFKYAVKAELIPSNPCHGIDKKAYEPRKNKPFTKKEITKIAKHLAKVDPQLYLFIQMVGYCWLRPQEVVRLCVGDIDFEKNTITVDTKRKKDKVKRLISKIKPDLEQRCKNQLASHYLFTDTGAPGEWNTNEVDKRNLFTKWFRLKVKKPFGFGPEYGIYSFRHSFSVELYNKLTAERGMTEQQAMFAMLPITGHQSISALKAYLRDVGAILPDDYSDLVDGLF